MRASAVLLLAAAAVACSGGGSPATDEAARGAPLLVIPTQRDQVFIYGGDSVDGPRNDALLVDVATGAQERLPDAPFAHGLAVPAGVRVDESIVVVGSPCAELVADEDAAARCEPEPDEAAVYSVEDETWRPLDVPPDLQQPGVRHHAVGATSDGRAVFVLGRNDLWTYDLADDRWDLLPPADVDVGLPCLAGDTVVVATALPDPSDARVGRPWLRTLDLAEPSSGWSDSPRVPRGGREVRPWTQQPAPTCVGEGTLVADPFPDTAYRRAIGDAGGAPWTPVPAFDVTAAAPVSWVAAGSDLVWLDGEGGMATLDLSSGTWDEAPPLPDRVRELIWTGRTLVGWDGTGVVVVDP